MKAKTVGKCPICQAESATVEHKSLFDDRYGFPGEFDIAKCATCKHRFTLPKLNERELQKVYSFYGRRRTLSADIVKEAKKSSGTPKIQRFFAGTNNLGQHFAPLGSRILDVGSGDCSNLVESILLGFDAVGFDVDKESQRLGTELSLNVQLAESTRGIHSRQPFSWIQLNQVVEHFIDPVSELEGIRRLLDFDGKVFIATPNVASLSRRLFSRKWINWHVPYHQHHFSKDSLKMLASRTDMEIESWRTVTPNVWAQLQVATLFTRQAKGSASHLWSNEAEIALSPLRRLLRMAVTLTSLIVSPFVIATLRMVDWIGAGDCHVVIMRTRS